jgi:hypothetical protein
MFTFEPPAGMFLNTNKTARLLAEAGGVYRKQETDASHSRRGYFASFGWYFWL